MAETEMFTLDQVAKLCGKPYHTALQWVETGKLQADVICGKVAVRRAALQQCVQELGVESEELSRVLKPPTPPTKTKQDAPTEKEIELRQQLRDMVALVKDLRNKMFFRDGYKVAHCQASLAEQAKVERENEIARQRWDSETNRRLAAILLKPKQRSIE